MSQAVSLGREARLHDVTYKERHALNHALGDTFACSFSLWNKKLIRLKSAHRGESNYRAEEHFPCHTECSLMKKQVSDSGN